MPNGPPHVVSTDRYGLAAVGASGSWTLTIDEALDRDDLWTAELEGPNLYLTFSFEDLKTVRAALDYLRMSASDRLGKWPPELSDQGGYPLGTFGGSEILLMWDDESPERCFLIIGPVEGCVARYSLCGDDILALTGAFYDAVAQLPDES